MNASQFDELTKALATSTSRRQALKTLAATAMGTILTFSGIGNALAKCKGLEQHCSNNTQCCSGFCAPETHECACAPGKKVCGNQSNSTCCPVGSSCCGSGNAFTCCPTGTFCCDGPMGPQCCPNSGSGYMCCSGEYYNECCPFGCGCGDIGECFC